MAEIHKIIHAIFIDMYKEAEPSVDFDKLIEESEVDERGLKIVPYWDYYLNQERQEEIIKEHLKGKRLTKLMKASIRNYVNMGISPSTIRK